MRWFRHFSDSHTNLKLRAVLHDLGLEGYAVYWLCLELVAQQGAMHFCLNQSRTWELALCTTTALKVDRLKEILKRFGELELICAKSLEEGKLAIPKMKEYMDAYTLRRVSAEHKKSVSSPLSVSVSVYNNIKHFDLIWSEYPNKVGKKEAFRHWQSSIKTEEDYNNIKKALENYKASDVVKKGFIQNGKTWFNNWSDWITPPRVDAQWDKYKLKEKK